MAWTELMEVEEETTAAVSADPTPHGAQDTDKEVCCKCLCEIKEILLRIESKMMASSGGESAGAEVIAYNERMR